jgi:PAS domain S-box-containing protein
VPGVVNGAPTETSEVAQLALRVADHAPAMLAYWNTAQVCLFANEAYRAWFGKSRSAVVGTTMRELLGPLYELDLPYILRALAGEPQLFERTIPGPGGVVRESLATYTPDIVDGVVNGFFVHVADVTAMKTLERDLAASKSTAERLATRLQTILETLPVGVYILNATGAIIEANSAARQIWGGLRYVTLDQLGVYRGWWAETGEPIAPEDWAGSRAVSRGDTSLDEVIDIECFDGTRKTILNSALPIYRPDGSIDGAVVVNLDITTRRRLEAERERLIRRLEAALSEVRTLRGLLPICMHCKRIRDADGRWTPVESYVRERTEAEFSHGICPQCVARHYPQDSPSSD